MSYFLVLQWHGESQPSYDDLMAIEDVLIDRLGDTGDVDGHDVGSDESSIFIVTDSPERCLRMSLLLIDSPYREAMVAGFRPMDGQSYTAIWPPTRTEFSVS